MEADQSFDEDDDDDEEEEEEDVKTSKKRPAASPASKSQVSLSASHCVTPQSLVQLGSTLTRCQCPCRRKWRWKWTKLTKTTMMTMTMMMSEYWVELHTFPKKYLCVINVVHNRDSHSDHLAAPRPSLVSMSSQENAGALCCVTHTAEGIVWFSVWLLNR